MINTLDKFINATGFDRGSNHPRLSNLKDEMDRLNISDDLRMDIMGFFQYGDHDEKVITHFRDESNNNMNDPVIKHFRDESGRDPMDDYEGTIKHFRD